MDDAIIDYARQLLDCGYNTTGAIHLLCLVFQLNHDEARKTLAQAQELSHETA